MNRDSLRNGYTSIVECRSAGSDLGGLASDLIDQGAHCVVSRACIPVDELRQPVPLNLISVCRGLGSALSYADEFEGAFVHHVRPVSGHQELQVSSGGVSSLFSHVEDSYHAWPPDYLILACVQTGPSMTPTTVAAVDLSMVKCLSDTARSVLSEPRFRFQYCYLTDLAFQYSPAFPVLDQAHDGSLRVRYSELGLTLCESSAAKEALEEFRSALPEVTAVTLGPGDVLIIDNHCVVHSRPPYEPTFDQNDRWLRRAFAVKESTALAGLRDGAFRIRKLGLEVAPIVDAVSLAKPNLALPCGLLSQSDFVTIPQAFTDNRLGQRVATAG